MNTHLFFDFSVDKKANAINVTREFAANVELVWEAWTNPEILDQWWAPKPYQTKTKSMDFKVGGSWFYAMLSPENIAHWCRADYKSIEHQKSFSGLDAFTDEKGNRTAFRLSCWYNGTIYVSDCNNHCIQCLLPNGILERRLGKYGQDPVNYEALRESR